MKILPKMYKEDGRKMLNLGSHLPLDHDNPKTEKLRRKGYCLRLQAATPPGTETLC